ncbi:hypothetical protein GYMLUDRAFT_208304 [Collybiopsis luxurians FD-317 M1]|uniref:Unplaced genomic scaffold GYMLUscaffold_101, whole genome shotgun sequence n=1 Tax=Collybiopsis luxurians FD-317 M1 TaxID=944289 RepID=A0A0D0CB65_9AGAR|nr:hypothetical protein GYMLUDRAFT_208304 [Collybiopsis luxurians FD-317 M1]
MAGSSTETPAFLDTVEGEISFFRSIMRARPVGIHRHFHILTMRNSIYKDTNHWVATDELCQKLKRCYDMDALDAIDVDYENLTFKTSSPTTADNLVNHRFFREEFSLPSDPAYESIILARRLNPVPSPPSSPEASAASPAALKVKLPKSKKRNGKSKASMAGLVGGESDSSDLTDSGEEGPAPSIITATDGGETADGEEEDVEMQDVTPGKACPPSFHSVSSESFVDASTTTKSSRRKSTTKKGATAARSRAAATNSSSRPAKKRKR